uniref:Protein FAM9A-like n=1 Tax=Geotrypetes seraphini TaxID=260995 RepID=A0A6P8SB54_GEOSA|nr:protein FAM9A-like [Geotrypetes seraphini]
MSRNSSRGVQEELHAQVARAVMVAPPGAGAGTGPVQEEEESEREEEEGETERGEEEEKKEETEEKDEEDTSPDPTHFLLPDYSAPQEGLLRSGPEGHAFCIFSHPLQHRELSL